MAYSVSYASTQQQFPNSNSQASGGTLPPSAAHDQTVLPCTAENAIGIPKLNASPSTACGIDTNRLAYG